MRWLATAALLVACGDDLGPPAIGVRVVQYNVANIGAGPEGDAIAGELERAAPDFAALEECPACPWYVNRLADSYDLVAAPRAGVAILYDTARWTTVDRGERLLGRNDDGWGDRVLRWSHLV